MENKKIKNIEGKGIMLIGILLISVLFCGFVLANQCNDGVDNDLDGKIDYPVDNGCSKATDNSESMILGYADGCLVDGEQLKNVFGHVTFQCESTLCPCCVLMTEAGNYTTDFRKCNGLPKCGFSNGGNPNITLDQLPPELIINSPNNGDLFNSRNVLFDLEFDEPASIYYLDNNDARRGYKRICSNCEDSYVNSLSFDEGKQNITIKAEDKRGNAVEIVRTFRVDYNSPKIKKVIPTKGFADGTFYIEFDEENPVTLELYYGVYGNLQVLNVDLSNCVYDKTYECEVIVNLSEFDSEQIDYYFKVSDIVGNTDTSKSYSLDVDVSNPVINYLNYEIKGKYVNFNISVNDVNFEEVGYSYIDSRGKVKMKKLCSKLINGICEKRVSFRDGNYDINVYVLDEAENMVGRGISFLIDSTKPKILKTSPKKGFASGDFEVEFKEDNPVSLVLHYGNDYSGYSSESIDISSNCEIIKGKYYCDFNSSYFDVFNMQDVSYWFELIDIKGNIVESKPIKIVVDLNNPILNNFDSFWEQGTLRNSKYIYFNFDIDEENFDEVLYYDYTASKSKWKRICSRLKDGICEKRVSFSSGHHVLDVKILDEAGNSVLTNRVDFVV